MNWCRWCKSTEAKYAVTTQETNSKTTLHACGRHLTRAVDWMVMAGGRTTVRRLL